MWVVEPAQPQRDHETRETLWTPRLSSLANPSSFNGSQKKLSPKKISAAHAQGTYSYIHNVTISSAGVEMNGGASSVKSRSEVHMDPGRWSILWVSSICVNQLRFGRPYWPLGKRWLFATRKEHESLRTCAVRLGYFDPEFMIRAVSDWRKSDCMSSSLRCSKGICTSMHEWNWFFDLQN